MRASHPDSCSANDAFAEEEEEEEEEGPERAAEGGTEDAGEADVADEVETEEGRAGPPIMRADEEEDAEGGACLRRL